MRGLATLCLRFRKPLSIALILLVIVSLLQSRGTLDAHLDQSPSLIVSSSGPKVPELSEWLASASAWTTDEKSDTKFNVRESFQVRQDLGRNLTCLFRQYRPPIVQINQSFLEKWPTMDPFQLNKKYDYSEVIAASENFFLEDESYPAFRTQQQSLIRAIPTWATVSTAYSGRGIVISAGASHLTRIWPNVVLMLRSLNSSLPIEVWTKDQEEYDRTIPLVHQIRTDLKVIVSVHTISDYIPVVWDMMNLPTVFKVKALALLFSSFEEAILLDADSIPVMDPNVLFDSEEGKSGLIQWPDFWSNSVSNVLHDVYDIDYSMARTCESGQLLINKKKQFEPLVLTNYYNWWGPDFFYKLIYLDSMGQGDKDTFWLGSAAYHRGYHVVERQLELITAKKLDGTLWKEQLNVFNGAMVQFNPSNTSEIFFMHLHAPKVDMQSAELQGQFDLVFFHADKDQNVIFAQGEDWLETRLWESLQWIECESILRDFTTNACEGISVRLAAMAESATSDNSIIYEQTKSVIRVTAVNHVSPTSVSWTL